MPTTLAQMGSVAKTQARGQQAAAPATPFADQLQKDDDLKVQRVREAEDAAQGKIEGDGSDPDKRKRRRLNRNRRQYAGDEDPAAAEESGHEGEEETEAEQLGQLIDMRV